MIVFRVFSILSASGTFLKSFSTVFSKLFNDENILLNFNIFLELFTIFLVSLINIFKVNVINLSLALVV